MRPVFDKTWCVIPITGVIVVLFGEGAVIYWNLAWYWAVAIFVPAFLCFSYWGSKRQNRKIEEHFGNRPILDDEEFGRHYFPSDRAGIATRLRKILGSHTHIDLSRINPTDRFIEDLLMDDYDSMATVNFVIEIEKEFDIQIPDSEAERMLTFESVVNYVAEAVRHKAN